MVAQLLQGDAEEKDDLWQPHAREAEETNVRCYADILDGGKGGTRRRPLWSTSWPALLLINVALVLIQPCPHVSCAQQEAGCIPCEHLLLERKRRAQLLKHSN
jgi:hypothetical protein